ncbi:hypothetical protein ACLMJK_002236 [Lecanora helva]
MAEGEELEEVRSRLDASGWNPHGECYPSTICRAWMMMALIRDEILELSLGPPVEAHSTEARRDNLKRRSEMTYAEMPSQLKYKPGDINYRTASQFTLVIALHQEYLLNSFLLDRLPTSGSLKSRQDLIDTARKMLDGILVLCANRDKLTNQNFFVWSISYSGIPSVAILSVELLKESKFPNDSRLALPRSEVIQNLSMFIGSLEWVRPSEGE